VSVVSDFVLEHELGYLEFVPGVVRVVVGGILPRQEAHTACHMHYEPRVHEEEVPSTLPLSRATVGDGKHERRG